jgi:EAL domain-containing protein (putative c-di-GMP-specific phosphodiesterase class I)
VRVAIDDFGTGYSSLSYLKRFTPDTLKLDRSFVTGLPQEADDVSIARAVISMAHSLGLRVVAEGVETPSQREFLAAHGCDEMQGYLFSKPLAPEALVALLDTNRSRKSRRMRQAENA